MPYPRLATAVKLVHWAFILSLATISWMYGHPTILTVYTVILWMAVLGNVFWCGCPLTILERSLRGEAPVHEKRRGSFIASRVKTRFGIVIPPWLLTFVLLACALSSTGLVYLLK